MLTGKSWRGTVDTLAEEIETELREEFDKLAAAEGWDSDEEISVIKRFQQNPNSEDFNWLFGRHQGLIYRASERYSRGATRTLPMAAIRSNAKRQYIQALSDYDPDKSKFSTHVYNWMRRLNRYKQRYSNIGRIPEERADIIELLQNRENAMKEYLGRDPSNSELADDMLVAMEDIPELRSKKRKVNEKAVGVLRRELRPDLLAEEPGGEIEDADSAFKRQAVFLHGSLNPEQQLVLEHTYEGFGRPIIEDPMELSNYVKMSPQKIRAIKKQIWKKIENKW